MNDCNCFDVQPQQPTHRGDELHNFLRQISEDRLELHILDIPTSTNLEKYLHALAMYRFRYQHRMNPIAANRFKIVYRDHWDMAPYTAREYISIKQYVLNVLIPNIPDALKIQIDELFYPILRAFPDMLFPICNIAHQFDIERALYQTHRWNHHQKLIGMGLQFNIRHLPKCLYEPCNALMLDRVKGIIHNTINGNDSMQMYELLCGLKRVNFADRLMADVRQIMETEPFDLIYVPPINIDMHINELRIIADIFPTTKKIIIPYPRMIRDDTNCTFNSGDLLDSELSAATGWDVKRGV